ncbi:hypothetical protein VTI74DRAFT_3742 [Chaetomium olivicolor]
MATKQAPSTNIEGQGGQGPLDEQQLQEMLSQLDQMHLQLRQLRSALPRMLEPLMIKQSSPQATYAAFLQAVESTNKEITGFREAVVRPTSRDIFKTAVSSQSVNPKGIKQWRARDDPDWANPDRKRRRIS